MVRGHPLALPFLFRAAVIVDLPGTNSTLRIRENRHCHSSAAARESRSNQIYTCTGFFLMSTCAHPLIPTSRQISIACTYAKRSWHVCIPSSSGPPHRPKLVRSKTRTRPKKKKERKGERKSRRLYLVGANLELPHHERSRLGTRLTRSLNRRLFYRKTSSIDGDFIVHVYSHHRFQ